MNLIIKLINSSEKMRNSGNHKYDYAHSIFGKIFYPTRYTGYKFLVGLPDVYIISGDAFTAFTHA